MSGRILVAGIGNLLLGDDGFGPEVVRRLVADGPLRSGVHVVDYGIRGVHLAYDLLDGWDTLILVDALPPVPGRPVDEPSVRVPEPTGADPAGSGRPGEVIVLEAALDDLAPGVLDVHGMHPVAVLGTVRALGGQLPPTYVVGCPAESVGEGIGLSPAVAAAVPAAADAVLALLGRPPLAGAGTGRSSGPGRS